MKVYGVCLYASVRVNECGTYVTVFGMHVCCVCECMCVDK